MQVKKINRREAFGTRLLHSSYACHNSFVSSSNAVAAVE
jgi:hypothetical protein